MLSRSWRLQTVAVITTAVFAGACLSSSHRIPTSELRALAAKPPETRGESVRVIQGWAGEDDPPEARRGGGGGAIIVHSNTTVGPRGTGRPRGGSGGGIGKSSKEAASKADEAWVWVIIAASAAVLLAATEGARYDGWVRIGPDHPVHLYGPNGYSWMPLSELDPETARWAYKALVRPSEGRWQPLGRAPLNRVGWTYSVLLGAAELPSILGTEEPGFQSHIQIGYFPTQQVGLHFDTSFAWTDNIMGERIFEVRYGGELQFLPLGLGKFHAGVYGAAGLVARFEDGPMTTRQSDTYLGGGILAQLELTTRLALTARGGVTRIFGDEISEAGVGVSIY